MNNNLYKSTKCLFVILAMLFMPVASYANFLEESSLINIGTEETSDSFDVYGHRLLPDSVYFIETFSKYEDSKTKITAKNSKFDNNSNNYSFNNCYPYKESIKLKANGSSSAYFFCQTSLDNSYSRVLTVSCKAWMQYPPKSKLYYYSYGDTISSVNLINTKYMTEYSFDIVQNDEDNRFNYGFGVKNGNLFFDDFKIVYHHWIEKTFTDGYCTLADYPHSLVVPENTEAYTLTMRNSVLYKGNIYKTGDAIPPHEAVVLHNTVDKTIRLREVADEGKKDPNNLLHGSSYSRNAYIIYPNRGDDYAGSFYVLGRDANKENIGFYWYSDNGNGSFEMPRHKAFLYIPPTLSGSKINSFKLDETATAINEVKSTENSDNRRYNLKGQLVGNNYKGIVIEHGKKILVK